MLELGTIDKNMLLLWRNNGFMEYTHHYDKKKRVLKFFLVNPTGVYRVRIKDRVVYEGTDVDLAVSKYNEL